MKKRGWKSIFFGLMSKQNGSFRRIGPVESDMMPIALLSLVLCFVLFLIGRSVGRHLGEEICSGQASFQKNTALSIWVAYTYLNPMASVGAGCYVLWQNIINSLELWEYRRKHLS